MTNKSEGNNKERKKTEKRHIFRLYIYVHYNTCKNKKHTIFIYFSIISGQKKKNTYTSQIDNNDNKHQKGKQLYFHFPFSKYHL